MKEYQLKLLKLKHERQLQYKCWNHTAERCVFLIHGLGDASTSYDQIINTLINKDIKIVAYDLPGCGNNESVHSAFSENMEILYHLILQEKGEMNYFIGHSLGGLILLLTLVRYPIRHEKVIAIEPSITQADYHFFKYVQEKPIGIGIDAFINDRISTLSQYKKHLKAANKEILKEHVKSVFDYFFEHQNQILMSGLSFYYLFGALSSETELRKKLEIYPNIKVIEFNHANHWVHIDQQSDFMDFIFTKVLL